MDFTDFEKIVTEFNLYCNSCILKYNPRIVGKPKNSWEKSFYKECRFNAQLEAKNYAESILDEFDKVNLDTKKKSILSKLLADRTGMVFFEFDTKYKK